MSVGRIIKWLEKNRTGLLFGAIFGVLLSVIALKTGNSFFVFMFPGVFFGGIFFMGSGQPFFTIPAWIEAAGIFANIIIFAVIGAWLESKVRKKK